MSRPIPQKPAPVGGLPSVPPTLSAIRAEAGRRRWGRPLPTGTPTARLVCAAKEANDLRAYAESAGISPAAATTAAVRFFLSSL